MNRALNATYYSGCCCIWKLVICLQNAFLHQHATITVGLFANFFPIASFTEVSTASTKVLIPLDSLGKLPGKTRPLSRIRLMQSLLISPSLAFLTLLYRCRRAKWWRNGFRFWVTTSAIYSLLNIMRSFLNVAQHRENVRIQYPMSGNNFFFVG